MARNHYMNTDRKQTVSLGFVVSWVGESEYGRKMEATTTTIEKNEEYKQYHQVYPGVTRKHWTDTQLILHGAKALSTTKTPNIKSVKLLKLKQVLRNQTSSIHLHLDSECVGEIFDIMHGHRKGLSTGATYYIEFEFQIEQENIPIHVYLSRPDQVVTDREVLSSSRTAIRSFLEINGYCSATPSYETPGIRAFFEWVSRAQNPTMTQQKFIETIGKPAFEVLKKEHIVIKYDWSCPVLVDSFLMLPKQRDCQSAFRIRPG